MESKFPNFDIYSTPLALLFVQGLIFTLLIANRYRKKKYFPDLLLTIFLFLFLFERIHYIIGFMSWYDSFPNTKINYFLIPMTLAIGPLLYFYVKSITNGNYRISKNDLLQFLPCISFVLYHLVLFVVDATMPGFAETQNGQWMSSVELRIVKPLMILASSFHLLLYLAFTLQLYYFYRKKIIQFYSNTYRLELNWVRNFLILYLCLFIYDVFQNITDSFIIDLHWTQKWWFHFISSAAILYFGIKGYFTKTEKLQDINFDFSLAEQNVVTKEKKSFNNEKLMLKDFMEKEKPFLNPDLSLKELASQLKLGSVQLSEIINAGFEVNFNDFVNQYRVEEVKKALQEGRQEQLSLVGIAYDCGFNSKATFNRVFKKLTSESPTEFIRKIKN